MYSLNMPVSRIRTKVRQEFERHRYVSQLQTVDVLLFQSHAEYQVSAAREASNGILYSDPSIDIKDDQQYPQIILHRASVRIELIDL